MNDIRPADPLALDPIDDAFRALMRPWRFGLPDAAAPRIRLDVTEQEGAYLVKAEIPGVRKEDIDVRIDGELVTIGAGTQSEQERKADGRVICKERQEGYASRSFMLACPVDDTRTEATYQDGLLQLRLPKKASVSARRVPIR